MSYRLQDRVLNLHLPDSATVILIGMARHANNDGQSCRPGVALLAAELGKSERTIQRGFRALEQRGLIRPVAHRRGGRGCATHWELVLDNWVDEYRPKGDRVATLLEEGLAQRVTPPVTKGDTSGPQTVTPAVTNGDTVATPVDQEPVNRTGHGTGERAAAPPLALEVPAGLEGFQDVLAGAKGYEPTARFYAKVAGYQADLDVEVVAMKIRAWCEEKHKPCSTGRLLNALEGDRQDLRQGGRYAARRATNGAAGQRVRAGAPQDGVGADPGVPLGRDGRPLSADQIELGRATEIKLEQQRLADLERPLPSRAEMLEMLRRGAGGGSDPLPRPSTVREDGGLSGLWARPGAPPQPPVRVGG